MLVQENPECLSLSKTPGSAFPLKPIPISASSAVFSHEVFGAAAPHQLGCVGFRVGIPRCGGGVPGGGGAGVSGAAATDGGLPPLAL